MTRAMALEEAEAVRQMYETDGWVEYDAPPTERPD